MKGRYNPEYILYRQVAYYLMVQYPKVLFHFDYAGNHLTKTQAGMMKAIQGCKGWPDLFIAQRSSDGQYSGLFLELKAEGTKIFAARKVDVDGRPVFASDHLYEQAECLNRLYVAGYKAEFAIGFEEAKNVIDEYIKG